METSKQLFVFKPLYFIVAVILFGIEVLIALYIKDNFIRPYVGDVLVVILLYCLIKSFINTTVLTTAIGVLLFSFVVETLQYFNFVKLIGLEKSTLANIVMGNYFAWADMFAYILGILIVLISEQIIISRLKKTQ
jgi:hypothetical protein